MTTFADQFQDMMPHSVGFKPLVSLNAYGAPTYGTLANYRARITQKVHKIIDDQGHEVISMTKLILNTDAQITAEHQVILPAGYSPQSPRILKVDRISDEAGLCYTRVYC